MKVPEGSLTLRQETAVSSEFHQKMLDELARHHDEKATDWSKVDPNQMVGMAVGQISLWLNRRDPRRLVHAANFLTIAWAISESKEKDGQLVSTSTDQEGRA